MTRVIVCRECGMRVAARGPGQRYCEVCSERRDMLRKRLWARDHPPSVAQSARNVEHAKRRIELAREAGALINQKEKQSIAWYDSEGPDLLWQIRVAIPFSYAASKNHIYALRKAGHVALRRESRAKREEIVLIIRQSLRNHRVVHNKVWIDIMVQKPDHRGDAVNVIDLVCDALKDALEVDDRWFCIRRLDWEVVRADPKLFIGIGQDSDRDCQVCSYCGQIKELSEFNANKHNSLGVGRECKQCRREGRRLRREENRHGTSTQ